MRAGWSPVGGAVPLTPHVRLATRGWTRESISVPSIVQEGRLSVLPVWVPLSGGFSRALDNVLSPAGSLSSCAGNWPPGPMGPFQATPTYPDARAVGPRWLQHRAADRPACGGQSCAVCLLDAPLPVGCSRC